MTNKRNIFLIGPSGVGKSTIGRQLSKLLKIDFFDSDQEIERRAGANIDWIIDVEGEKGFRIREEKIITELTKKNGIVLATGSRSIISRTIRSHLSVRGIVIYLKMSSQPHASHTKIHKDKTMFKKMHFLPGIDLEKFENTQNLIYEELSDIIIHSHGQSIKAVTKQILSLLDDSL
ncbi:shikimate kinase AroK [Candidatus Erwinia haradaeae]|uniref:Shikimate kinase 1 n=1 Tax=Candidatus Erwinia haradaeae TaxID=1922217 RepID=A0A451D3M9_9GAMM|nr:shikimate kinase AroK [Candidatus Erwinia haradaeae]VFP80256.1 Shikimate kinase 1 [Candidatus Erwinia haradaeae]